MAAAPSPAPGPLRARQCPACQRAGPCGPEVEGCPEVWADRCQLLGDHRGCLAMSHDCPARWALPAIARAGAEACQRTGRPLAVICAHPDHGPERTHLVGTLSDLWSGKGLRNSHGRRHPELTVQSRKGVCFVVNAAGEFL